MGAELQEGHRHDQRSIQQSEACRTLRDSLLTVTVWKNAGDKGPKYSATTSRSSKKDDAWKCSA